MRHDQTFSSARLPASPGAGRAPRRLGFAAVAALAAVGIGCGASGNETADSGASGAGGLVSAGVGGVGGKGGGGAGGKTAQGGAGGSVAAPGGSGGTAGNTTGGAGTGGSALGGGSAGTSAGGAASGGKAGSSSGGNGSGGKCTSGTGGSGVGPTELCGNGVDDNGNGKVDENCGCSLGTTQKCYVGSPDQAGVGLCGWGAQTCVTLAMGEVSLDGWGPCTGSGKPATEACNGKDDDCNGIIDDCCQCQDGATQACATSCGAGKQTCAGGAWGTCSAPAPGPNGACPCVDGTKQTCTVPCGTGEEVCSAGKFGACSKMCPTMAQCAASGAMVDFTAICRNWMGQKQTHVDDCYILHMCAPGCVANIVGLSDSLKNAKGELSNCKATVSGDVNKGETIKIDCTYDNINGVSTNQIDFACTVP